VANSEDLLDLVASTLELDRKLLTPDLTIEEIGADSLDVLKLTYAIEQKYRINLSAYSHADIRSLDGLLSLLQIEIAKQSKP
jgi:acyl carrier protein